MLSDKKDKEIQEEWHLFNAEGKVLGRMAVEVAGLLTGKHRLDYAPHKVVPVFVVVINTDKIVLTGKKEEDKLYRRYSGYPGRLRERTAKEQKRRDSRKVIRNAVSGMLAKNKLRKEKLRHLKLYCGEEHPHKAQLK
jgi:large subunit ribosomal protein L13